MEPAVGSGSTDAPAAPATRDGVVLRPGLFERLTQAERVAQVSAPPGSGKTVLLRSWIAQSGLAGRVAWVQVPPQCDAQRFWISVTGALRDTAVGSVLVRALTAAPDLDGWTVIERLLDDLASLEERVWLVIDDVHELSSADALRQLELLIMRAPPALRFVLVTRHDLRLGLHRLRVVGELTEVRTADLRFTRPEARALLDAATGAAVPDAAAAQLYDRTEGWAAGLRLAALSLAGASPRQRCGWPRTIRGPPSPCSRPSSTGPRRWRTRTCGTSRGPCCRRSRTTRCATQAPPGARSSGRLTSPRRRTCSSRSCTIRRPTCSTATGGSAPPTEG